MFSFIMKSDSLCALYQLKVTEGSPVALSVNAVVLLRYSISRLSSMVSSDSSKYVSWMCVGVGLVARADTSSPR